MPTTAVTTRPPATPVRRRAARGALALVAALTIGAACAGGTMGPGESGYEANVKLGTDSTLRVARTQLELHGFTVTAAGENALLTSPRPLRPDLQSGSTDLRNRQWMLRVEASRRALVGGSRLRVIGYLLPPITAEDARTAGPTSQPAVLITSDQPALFGEVRAVGGWIEDAAGRANR